MTDEEVEEVLRTAACRRVKPIMNREVPHPRDSYGQDGDIVQTVWEHGYRRVRSEVIEAGATDDQVDRAMAKAKGEMSVFDPEDFVIIPADLLDALDGAWLSEIGDGDDDVPEGVIYELDERFVGSVDGFRIEMFSNESQHAGRPHVKVHLGDGAISVSLDDDPPQKIAGPKGRLRRENEALRVVAGERKRLLDLWFKTRPDDQKVKSQAAMYRAPQPPQPPAPPAPPAPPPKRSR